MAAIPVHEREKQRQCHVICNTRTLRGPDRWSERVSALGPAARREAPQARGKQERDRQRCWPLREPEQRPAACLVAAPRAREDGVDRKRMFTVKYTLCCV